MGRQLNRRVEFVVTRGDKTVEVVVPEVEVISPEEAVAEPTETKAEEDRVVEEEDVEEEENVEDEMIQVEVDESSFLTEEEVQAIHENSNEANAPFFTDSELNIINNKITRIATEYGIESKIQIHMINDNNRIHVTAINFDNDMQNDSFDKAIKSVLDGWFLPEVNMS